MRLWLFDLTMRERRTMVGCFGGEWAAGAVLPPSVAPPLVSPAQAARRRRAK